MQWHQVFGYSDDRARFCVAADGREILFADFCRDLARAAALLEAFPLRANKTAALYSTDTYEFCVWLFAALARNCSLVVPANNKRATVQALADVDVWLGDWPHAEQNALALSALENIAAPDNESRPSEFSGELIMFTSGSSGEPERIRKTLPQLWQEVFAQQQLWAEMVSGSCVLATVSHQHIYGLLFKVLWPLHSGRAFVSKTYVDVAALLRDAESLAPAIWVASPAQLSRRNESWPWAQARHLRAIFSSGGPLAAEDAAAIATLSGQWPREIYGSTETGGIAWRQQRDGNTQWMPLDGVQVAADDQGLLQVQSPWVDDIFSAQDRVRIDGDRFALLGRADQIAKIEEKRISLTQVERLLNACPLVDIARVLALPKNAQRSRDLLGALLVLSVEGRNEWQRAGKSALVRRLRSWLAPDLDGVALPRSWRFVATIPVNQQGKSPRELLMQAFESDTDRATATPDAMLPEIISARATASEQPALHTAHVHLRIPRALPCLRGHFDTAPVVPGVVQIDWAMHFGKSLLAIAGEFAGMENIKFKQLLVPDEQAELELSFDSEKQKLSYRFFWQNDEFSSGKLSFQNV